LHHVGSLYILYIKNSESSAIVQMSFSPINSYKENLIDIEVIASKYEICWI